MMPNTSEDVADALTRLALNTPANKPFPFLQLPDGVILDIIELLQGAYVAQEERAERNPLINLRL